MTNGEKLQKTFPNNEIDTLSTKIIFTLEPRTLRQQVFVFDKDWWNAEYKDSAVEIKKLKDIDTLDKFVDANGTCYHVKPLKSKNRKMTNGENIKHALSDFTFEEFGDTISGERYSPYCKVQFDRSWWNAECKESTVDCISKTETLKAMNSLDKFGYTAQYGLERLDKDDTGFVAYVKYDDVVKCIKGMTYEES